MTNQDPSRDEAKLREVALDFARREKKKIAKRLTDQDRFPPEAEPVSVFMAGSPGAGLGKAKKDVGFAKPILSTNISLLVMS